MRRSIWHSEWPPKRLINFGDGKGAGQAHHRRINRQGVPMRVTSVFKQLAIAALALFACASWAAERISFPSNGQQLAYTAHVPAIADRAKSRPWVLVVIVRSKSSRASNEASYQSLVRQSEELGFVLLVPEQQMEAGKIDGTLVNAVIMDATRRFRIDLAAVYLAAPSSGGVVVQRVAVGHEDGPDSVEWASQHLQIDAARTRRGRKLAWCLDPKARRQLSMSEWFCAS
jgi:poly(3-hydroxybutyrate) depolymerase